MCPRGLERDVVKNIYNEILASISNANADIIAAKEYKSSVSSPIIKIAIVAITLGIAIMLVAVAVSSGFQQKIRDKIAGFKGHIQITNYDNNNSDVSTVPIDINQGFYPNFKEINGIKKVQPYINKGGILRTPTDFQGIVFKGVNKVS